MPILTNHEPSIAAAVADALSDLARDVRAYFDSGVPVNWMGWTVRWGSVIARELREAFLDAAEALVGEHDGWLSDGDDRAATWASGRANWLVAGMATTTANAVVGATRYEDVEYLFSDSRASVIAATENTEAISKGQFYARDELLAIAILLIPVWDTEDDADVCPICDPFERQRQNVWQGDFPTGPPAHPNCRCRLSWMRV